MAIPTKDQLMGQLRAIIPAVGVIVSAVGVSSTQVDHYTQLALSAVGPIAYLIVAAWSWGANSRASIMASAAKPLNAQTPAPQIVLPPQETALAQSLPSNVNTTNDVSVVAK